eukprot:GSA25T00023995001.1
MLRKQWSVWRHRGLLPQIHEDDVKKPTGGDDRSDVVEDLRTRESRQDPDLDQDASTSSSSSRTSSSSTISTKNKNAIREFLDVCVAYVRTHRPQEYYTHQQGFEALLAEANDKGLPVSISALKKLRSPDDWNYFGYPALHQGLVRGSDSWKPHLRESYRRYCLSRMFGVRIASPQHPWASQVFPKSLTSTTTKDELEREGEQRDLDDFAAHHHAKQRKRQQGFIFGFFTEGEAITESLRDMVMGQREFVDDPVGVGKPDWSSPVNAVGKPEQWSSSSGVAASSRSRMLVPRLPFSALGSADLMLVFRQLRFVLVLWPEVQLALVRLLFVKWSSQYVREQNYVEAAKVDRRQKKTHTSRPIAEVDTKLEAIKGDHDVAEFFESLFPEVRKHRGEELLLLAKLVVRDALSVLLWIERPWEFHAELQTAPQELRRLMKIEKDAKGAFISTRSGSQNKLSCGGQEERLRAFATGSQQPSCGGLGQEEIPTILSEKISDGDEDAPGFYTTLLSESDYRRAVVEFGYARTGTDEHFDKHVGSLWFSVAAAVLVWGTSHVLETNRVFAERSWKFQDLMQSRWIDFFLPDFIGQDVTAASNITYTEKRTYPVIDFAAIVRGRDDEGSATGDITFTTTDDIDITSRKQRGRFSLGVPPAFKGYLPRYTRLMKLIAQGVHDGTYVPLVTDAGEDEKNGSSQLWTTTLASSSTPSPSSSKRRSTVSTSPSSSTKTTTIRSSRFPLPVYSEFHRSRVEQWFDV